MGKIKASKNVWSRNFPELIMSDKKAAELQEILLKMLVDFDKVCRDNNIKYFLSGGTLLGAIRHEGFIPWDDDIDVMMFKNEYDKIPELISKEFPDKYTVVKEMTSAKDATCCQKIYLNGTKYVELLSENWEKEQKIYIDIFAIYDVPSAKFSRKIRGLKYDIATRCAALNVEYHYPSQSIMKKAETNEEVCEYSKQRRKLGKVASLLSVKVWNKIAKGVLKYSNSNSEYVALPSGIRYNREVLPKGVFASAVEVDFEGHKFFAPIGYEKYLTNLYHDYMQIPPPEKRERHIAVDIDFGKYGKENAKDNE